MNCGFEAGNFNNWSLSGNDVPIDLGNLYGVEGTDPFDGIAPNSGNDQAYFGTLDANATTLTQPVVTIPGVIYLVSFYLAQDTTPRSTQPEDQNDVSVSFGGQLLLSTIDLPVQPYSLMSYSVTASSTSSPLSFTFGNGLGEFLLDDVEVTPNAVPEPAAGLLFLIGAILGGVLYRRKQLAG